MAGIGFELKKLFNSSTIFSNFKAYGYSTIVTVGPMFLCIIMILVTRYLLKWIGAPSGEIELFMSASQYAFIFSQIITGGFTFSISRYVADQTYLNKNEYILSSMYGLISICVMLGGVVAFIFYFDSPLDFAFKLSSFLFFICLIIIWVQAMYVSALKDYIKIVRSFIVGVLISTILILISVILFKFKTATAIFICLDVGFFIMVLQFSKTIRDYFPVNNQLYFHFLIYLEKHPYLFWGGYLFTIGLYSHLIMVWFTKYQVVIKDTFYIAPFYDVPVFFSYLTVLPSMILFMVSVETNFYKSHKLYYHRVIHGASLKDILNAKKKLFKVVSLELTFIAEIQLFVVITSIAIGVQFFPEIGMTPNQIHIFTVLTLGNLFFILMNTIVIMMLYFDAQKITFSCLALFSVSSITLVGVGIVHNIYGFPMFISSFLAFSLAFYLLRRILNNIDYNTYCTQPIIYFEQETKIEAFLKKLKHHS
ncbi:exopolysaccharide Pel transporter PelG [Pontibacillus sp. HMF3514]|uniref:exopolysaccharide Pel transporter PelG n=1 Tax=Pontibacillus sp. HMF3514 TaxID=2692425 RepID=UPI00131F9F50|nr:exopolysaccharide Pel transporter PelG [Pontibacillus sp. HMF3514]QHE53634.1 exopolysaccharide Pel transporter PelG [Pontibacillus sp. HMF3514]